MTKAQIISDLKKLIGPGIEVDDNGLLVWVNDAYMQIVDAITSVNPDFFTKSATADTDEDRQEYELPEDFERAIMVTLTLAGVVYRPRPLDTINNIAVYGGADVNNGYDLADPRYYIIGQNIGFLPVPTEQGQENIKLWYVYTPAELSADSDEPAFPAKYHHIIKYGAYANYLDQDDEHVAAENMRRRFDRLIERMQENMSQNQLDEPKSVQISEGLDIYYDSFDE